MRTRKGFTLIELLIVVAIIAILAAIAVPNFLEAQVRSKVGRAKADMRTIVTAIESYVVDNNKYPYTKETPYPLYLEERFRLLTTPVAYITSIPVDPFGTGKLGAPIKDASGNLVKVGNKVSYGPYDFLCWQSVKSFGWGMDWWTMLIKAMQGNNGLTAAELAQGTSVQYYLSSVGPDRVPGATLTQAAGFGLPYDATNGTVSTGDIVRLGP